MEFINMKTSPKKSINQTEFVPLNEKNSAFVPQKIQDSISKALPVEKKILISRPQIPVPVRFASIADNVEKTKDILLTSASARIDEIHNQLEHWHEEQIQTLKQTAEKVRAEGTWSMVKNIANAFLSISSVLLGAACIAGGGAMGVAAGGFLVTGGICSFTSLVLDAANAPAYLTGTFSVIALICSLIGGGIAYSINQIDTLGKVIGHIVQLSMLITKGCADLTTTKNQYDKAMLDADLKAIQKELEYRQITIDITTEDLRPELKHLDTGRLQELIKNYRQSIRGILDTPA
ncbi:MAG: hypothetical protein WDZ28_05400 [Simkaniaceae bacterium]